MFVRNMHESVVKNHLVKGQFLLQYELCKSMRIVRSDVRCLAFGVLGMPRSFESFVQCLASVLRTSLSNLLIDFIAVRLLAEIVER